ncbi:P-type ATPase, partial [Leclercia adecarboxylata]|uniref:P-type ATPase n=1 Tax=Leclercia adecarboxylata TaxID=83655 RepID=UPI00234C1EDD
SAVQAEAQLRRFGRNEAASDRPPPLWLQFLARFRSPLVVILLVASALSAVTGDAASFVIVMTVVTASITLDFVQEVRAQNAVEALRRSVAIRATVRRDGAVMALPVDGLVPGDIVELIAGDLIPADCRLIASRNLYVNQALLTGEPYPSEKQASDQGADTGNPADADNAV